jgi:hypothetical protein
MSSPTALAGKKPTMPDSRTLLLAVISLSMVCASSNSLRASGPTDASLKILG